MRDRLEIYVIEVTPAMIEAGCEAFTAYDSRVEDPEDAVVRVFEAMLEAYALKLRESQR